MNGCKQRTAKHLELGQYWTKLQAGWSEVQILVQKEIFLFYKMSKTGSGAKPVSYSKVPGVISQGSGGHGRMLTIHVHLAVR